MQGFYWIFAIVLLTNNSKLMRSSFKVPSMLVQL